MTWGWFYRKCRLESIPGRGILLTSILSTGGTGFSGTPWWWEHAGAQLWESADKTVRMVLPQNKMRATTCCRQWVTLRISAHSVTPVQHMPRSVNPGLGNWTGYQRRDQVWLYHLPWTRGKSPNLQPSWEGSHKVITWICKIQCQTGVMMIVADLKTVAVSMGSLEGEEGKKP
jgi:hypothetical protein